MLCIVRLSFPVFWQRHCDDAVYTIEGILRGAGAEEHLADSEFDHVDASEAADEAGAISGPGKSAYMICASCHCPEGEGNAALHARALAGQELWYLKRQIQKFKDGHAAHMRRTSTERRCSRWR